MMADNNTPPPIDPALRTLLDANRVPVLSDDFADRVLAARTGRHALPAPRPNKIARPVWVRTRQAAIGVAVAAGLATAAAATGVLKQVGIDLPPLEEIVESISQTITPSPKSEPTPKSEPARAAPEPPIDAPGIGESIIQGPIDSIEKLDQAFEVIDRRREARKAGREERIKQRVDAAIERRKAAGLPVPTDAQRERFREGVKRRFQERDAIRRDELRQRVEDGEAIDPAELRYRRNPDGAALPPEERRARRRERFRRWRMRRQGGQGDPLPEVIGNGDTPVAQNPESDDDDNNNNDEH